MAEIFVQREGALRWAQVSGNGLSWQTAAAAPTGLMGFIQSFSIKSAQTVTTIMDRGVPSHHKVTDKPIVEVDFSFLSTGYWPTGVATNSLATTPQFLMEFKQVASNSANGSAVYHQFYGVGIRSVKFDEGKDGNTITLSTYAVTYTGPTASGYMA